MKKKIKIKKIISFLLVLCMMMQLIPQSAIQISATSSGTTEISLNTATTDKIYLLTKDQFVRGDSVETGSGEYCLKEDGDSEASKTVYIGDETYNETEYKGKEDITVDLKAVQKSLTLLQINPVSNGSYTTKLTVSEASKIGELKIQENAKAKITLNADLEISKISMGKGSELKIDSQGYQLKVAGEITGNGDVTLTGKKLDIAGINVDNLTLDDAELTANNKAISANEQLTVKNSTVENASLLGYGDDITGKKTLTFAGSANKLNKITAVGTSETGKATVTIEGENTITSSSDITYYCDYSLTYRNSEQELNPKAAWPVSYRTKFQGNMSGNAQIIGYHNSEGTYKTADTIALPEYTEDGYNYVGWKIDNATVTQLPASKKGNQTLTAVLQSENVEVSLDLGYDPDEKTNDDYNKLTRVTKSSKEWGDSVNLTTPKRFGYRFTGWKVKSVEDGEVYQNQTSYTVAMKDAEKLSKGGYQITLEAQWEAKEFPFRFLISTVEAKNVKVQVGNEVYASITAFAEHYKDVVKWVNESSMLEFSKIKYDETLQAYMERMGISEMPKLIDKRSGESKLDFSGWSTQGGNIAESGMSFTMGSLLDNKTEGETLESYESDITTNPVYLTSRWGTASYTLTTDIADGWEILVDGEVQTPSALTKLKNTLSGNNTMSIKVKAGSQVTWRCSASDAPNFSLWNFTEGFQPEETKMVSGAKYITYTATMPYKDITATKSEVDETYIDISQSPITFEENVKLPSGRTADGFWYQDKMISSESNGMQINAMSPAFVGTTENSGHEGEYFYVWKKSDAFHLTSDGKETTNQLVLTNAITVTVKNCKMSATDTYNNNAVGSEIGGQKLGDIFTTETGSQIESRLKNVQLKDYANILIDTTKTNAYTVVLNIEDDESQIMDISTDGFHTASQYQGVIQLKGTGSTKKKLKLGTVFGDFKISMNNLEVSSYDKKDTDNAFNYAVYTSFTGAPSFKDCTIDMKERDIYTFDYSMTVDNTNFKVRNVRLYYNGLLIYGNSNVHIYEDVYSYRHTITMSGNSNAVIDGNVVSVNQDIYASGKIETTGYLIVKGTVFDSGNMEFKKGTVICNILEVGSQTTYTSQARIITNMITGNVHNSMTVENGKYVLNNGSSRINSITKLTSNEDDYPFITYTPNSATQRNYTFGGDNTKIYLYGYYKTSNNYYDTTIKATDTENPVKQWISQCIDDDGELKTSLSSSSLSDADLQTSIKNYTASKDNECIILGNSTYTSQTEMPRNAIFSGANIYAAGNVTLFNDTTVSKGNISCNGSFGTKGELTVSGGTINADTVGNVGNITANKADKTKYWRKTKISGGTINAKTIGARDSYGEKGTAQRSYVDITGGTIANGTTVRKDEYVNYIYDKNDFPDSQNGGLALDDNVRMSTTWTTKLGEWKTTGIPTLPVLTDSTGTKGSWAYAATSGPEITGIGTDGQVLPEASDKQYVQDNDQIVLYATKSQYTLTKVYGTSDYSLSVDGDSNNINFKDTAMMDIADMTTKDVPQADVKKGAKVKLTVTDEKYKDRTVVWYKDGNGQYHNALSNAQWEGTSITFDMPNGNTYIYVVEEGQQLPLDLYASGLSFTKDGFITEYASVDSNGDLSAENKENVFKYSGDYKIVQSNLEENSIQGNENGDKNLTLKNGTSTPNRIRFAKDFDNYDDTQNDAPKIYVHRVYQQCEDALMGVVMEDGANVKLQIEGKNTLFRFSLKENSKLDISGKTGNSTDVLYFLKATSNIPRYNSTIIGNVNQGNYGKTGDCVIENLDMRMRSGYAGYLMYGATSSGQGTLTIDNCILDRSIWGDTGAIGINLKDVTIKQSLFKLPCATSHTTSLFQDCTNVTIKDKSEIHWTKVGSTNTGGHPIDYGVKDTLTIDNSTVEVAYEPKMTAGTMLVNEGASAKAEKVVLKNNADVKIDSRAVFNSLEVTSGANFTVNQTGSEDTYLLCPNVTVDGGTINTDYLVVSGYHHPKTTGSADYAASKAALDNKIKQMNNMEDGTGNTGLVIKDGTVNANKFAGGDMNGKITVQGGTLNSAQIGTSGKLFGFTKPLPANKTDFVYQYDILDYSNYTQSCDVKISGGTVNVAENGYLGGMNSNVELTGGAIKLADQAVLGMTDKQASTLKDYYSAKNDDIGSHVDQNCNVNIAGGSITQTDGDNVVGHISAPYGKISISGQDAKVKIAKMSSDHGTIEITKANDAYDNPYTGNEPGIYRKNRIGIWVTDTLSAQTVKISDGAQVYAENAYAEITNNQGVLSVKEAALYSKSYGEKGIVRNDDEKQYNDKPNVELQTVFGTKMVTVSYDLNPGNVIFDSDLAEIENPNPESYTVSGTATKITLTDLESAGYEFKGWYNNKECSGEAVTSLNQTIQNDFTLYAKWERVKVKFKIIMDADSDEFAGNSNWTPDGNSYVYTKQPEITYGDKILSVSGVNLKDYTSNTMGATELEISEGGYTGTKAVNADTIVTKELAKYYKDNNKDTITLRISKVQKRYATVKFSLNQKDGKPVDAKFNQTSIGMALMELEDSIGVDQQLANVEKFADSSVTDTKSEGLIKPSATGYTFIGWNTNPDATQETTTGWVTAKDTFKANTTVYAIWQANTYKIEFNAGAGTWVTSSKTEPKADEASNTKLYYYWMYDTPITEDNSFWIKEEGTDNKYMQDLPYAWKDGSTFDNANGWTYSYEENGQTISGKIDSAKVLSGVFIKALNVAFGSPDGNPQQTALKLTAAYTPVKVTYDRNGGEWTNKDNKDETEPGYGEALYGYTEGEATNSEEVVSNVVGENKKTYQVRSTTADEFNQAQKFISTDYRNDLSRKGYTFQGWEDADGNKVGTTPRFKDVKLKAVWKANSYSLTLNSLESGDSNYSSFNKGTDAPVKDVEVTVGKEIDSPAWPSRNGDWYAYNKTDTSNNQKRYLLGFTFQKLDPGSTLQESESGYNATGYNVYQNYAQTITNMQNNSKTLYQSKVTSDDNTTEGTIFQLPKDGSYPEDIKGSVGSDKSYEVPDYPDGCNIEMYAVYRERSLVFVERYIDPDGNVKQQVKYSTAWNEWSDYPENTYGSAGNSKITDQGYSLIGWYVNGTTTAAAPYPTSKASYTTQMEGFKTAAANLGTYDIMVYTVYVAQVERSDITLTAKKDPTSKELSTNSYTLPSSMQSGNLSLEITSKDNTNTLNLVSKAEMEKHQYDQTWTDSAGTTHTSDDTVAIIATISKGNTTKEVELSDVVNGNGDFKQQVEAGWQLTFTLYHSKVMTKESNYEVDVKAKFSSTDSGSSLDNQWILNKIQVKLQPSEYKVRYKINLPEETSKLSITDTEDFKKPTDENAEEITKEVTLGYGSTLSDNLPAIEGYKAADGWKYEDSTNADADSTYKSLTMKVNENNQGVIDLTRDYTANTYELSADNQTLRNWNITYSDGAKDTTADQTSLSSDKKDVKYHSLITFTPKTAQEGNVPEFITLTLGSGETKKVKLSEYAAKDETTGAYTFKMPAESIAASYVTEETMYLEEGTISITENGYKQDKTTGLVNKKWPGNYVILQNKDNNASKATDHQLILSGNLSTKKIQIGNLNISTKDSIKLEDQTNAKITMGDQTNVSALTAKNIKVPQTSQFSCEPEQDQTGSQTNAIVALSPDKGTAGIGDTAGNGTITLNHLKISTVMPTSSTASAIGSDSKAQAFGSDIKLTNSDLIVEESSDTSTYQGTWIGGKSVTDVTIDHATINKSNDKNMAGPLITNADKVNISDSTIGTQQPVTDPVYATSELNIENSNIYQNIKDNITANQEGNAPVGTEDGTTKVTNSTINTTTSGGVSEMTDLYSGSLYIKDADSDVTIDRSQIVELSNGSVNINTTAYDQNNVTHAAKSARRNYVLLEEGNVPQTSPDLTVTSMETNTTIEVRQPSGKNGNTSNAVTAGNLKTATDINLVLKGNLTLTGNAQITDAAEKAVKVTSNDNNADHTLKIQGNAFTDNSGSYTQTGGKLESNSDIGSGKLDVTLDGTQVDTKNLYAKNLTLNSSNVKATEAVGSKPESSENAKDVTKVSINNTTVNAAEIGALGTYDKTFTIVKADNSSVLTGTVIKDEYRMTYDKNGATLNTDNLPKVLRTSTPFANNQAETDSQITIEPSNGILGDPSGDTNSVFSGWYINEKGTDNAAIRKALKANGTLPGIKETTTLNADTINKMIASDITSNKDETKTITVHAWLNATGEVVIEKGRKFVKTSEKTTKITIQANGAWTAQLTSTGTFIDGRDYQAEFSQALPEGTKLTLTIPKTARSAGKYYYYDVTDDKTTVVKFSEFKEMGSSKTFKSETYESGSIPANEVYLLSVDYAQTGHSAVNGQTVTFKLIPESTSSISLGNEVTYNLSPVSKGNISVADKTVTIAKLPSDDDNLSGQKLYVKAVFKKNNTTNDEATIPFNTNATLGTTKGKWISRDTVVFELGTYGSVQTSAQNYNFEGLTPSDYKITWSLVYGDGNSNNIVGNVVSNEVDAVNE